jgi:hypothetical protein
MDSLFNINISSFGNDMPDQWSAGANIALLSHLYFYSLIKLQNISTVACANSKKSHLSPTLAFIIYRINTMQDNNRYNKPTQTELSPFSSVGEHCY